MQTHTVHTSYLQKFVKFLKEAKELYMALGFVASIFVGIVTLIVVNRVQPLLDSNKDIVRRVSVLEIDNADFKAFTKQHTEDQYKEQIQLEKNGVLLELMADYFHLTPKEYKK